jgi:ureidoglycolate hydrolase
VVIEYWPVIAGGSSMRAPTVTAISAQPLDAQLFAPYGEVIYPRSAGLLARHRRVTQCLGSLQGKEWFIAVAPPGDLTNGARPDLAWMAAFRIPGDCVIKLHVATWHAGPHFTHEECLFFNLENLDTNKRDFEDYDLPNEFRISS